MIHASLWARELRQHFGESYNSDETWFSVQRNVFIGDIVTGCIVARAGFGVWLDIGVGYPALLEVPGIKEPDFSYPLYQQGEWGHMGTELNARIADFRDNDKETRQIRLIQTLMDFGDTNGSEEKWLAVQGTLSPGDTVKGPVICRTGFGVFLDIGVGYPALLETGQLLEPNHTLYWQDKWGQVGTELTARVATCRTEGKLIHLVL